MILQRLFDRQQTAAMIWQLTYGKKVEISATTTKIQELETTIRRLKIRQDELGSKWETLICTHALYQRNHLIISRSSIHRVGIWLPYGQNLSSPELDSMRDRAHDHEFLKIKKCMLTIKL